MSLVHSLPFEGQHLTVFASCREQIAIKIKFKHIRIGAPAIAIVSTCNKKDHQDLTCKSSGEILAKDAEEKKTFTAIGPPRRAQHTYYHIIP